MKSNWVLPHTQSEYEGRFFTCFQSLQLCYEFTAWGCHWGSTALRNVVLDTEFLVDKNYITLFKTEDICL